MKYLLLFTFLISNFAFSDSKVNFNKALQEDLKTEIKKDDFKYKKKSHRAPASVEADSPPVIIQETPKIDKTIRQIGPNKW